MPDPVFVIECQGLTRRFGDFTAVDSIELHVKKGELFGFLGPNGAGKTTTIRMLTTLIPITAGKAKVAGFDPITEGGGVRAKIGVVPQQFALFAELTSMENLWYIGKLYGMPESEIKKASESWLSRVSLFDKKDVAVGGFSGGMKQRLSIAAGLLHTPEILFMDEPTTGLDPQSRITLRELTRELNKSGITIVYTTHDMVEADLLCDRIAIMDKGKIIAQGSPLELKRKYGAGTIVELDLDAVTPALARDLKKLLGAKEAATHNHTVELRFDSFGKDGIERVTNLLSKRHLNPHGLRISEPTLEEVFINLTKKDLRDQ